MVDLGRIRRVRARHTPADIDVVADHGGKGHMRALVKNRFEHEQIRQVHAAGIGVVQAEDIALAYAVAIFLHHGPKGAGNRAQMPRQSQALRHQPAAGVAEGGGKVHVVLEDAGIGGAHHGQRHLIGDRVHGILEELEQHGVAGGGHGRHSRAGQDRSGARSLAPIPRQRPDMPAPFAHFAPPGDWVRNSATARPPDRQTARSRTP